MLSFQIAMKRYLPPVLLASLCAAPLALGVHAQQQQQQRQTPAPAAQPAPTAPTESPAQTPPPTPAFRADINFIRDVIVSDKKGNPVGDLRQQDFEVTEDGKPQSV